MEDEQITVTNADKGDEIIQTAKSVDLLDLGGGDVRESYNPNNISHIPRTNTVATVDQSGANLLDMLGEVSFSEKPKSAIIPRQV